MSDVAPLSPADFRADLSDAELVALADEENWQCVNDICAMRAQWGMLLQVRRISTDVLFDPDFDPVDYGLARRARPEKKAI